MNKFIITTTINAPTEAINKFDSMSDWTLIVIGDLKTPKDYKLSNGIYISPDEQARYDRQLSDAIGWNCIQRRNFGFLWAHDMNADIVAVVDDDNIPNETWGTELLLTKKIEVDFYKTTLPVFDAIGATNYKNIWHRGFPLQLLSKRDYSNVIKKIVIADIQADFWNGDPDIDAICRMEHMPECSFDEKVFPFSSNAIAPFNSQNTFLKADLLDDYFLFPYIGRMDDIWASYYIQAKRKCNVVFNKPSVYQKRNPHDLIKDMQQEYLGYENNLKIITEIRENPDALLKYLPERSRFAFNLYKKHFNL